MSDLSGEVIKRKNLYRSFEDKYRGSRELIKQRLTAYLPFILPLKNVYQTPAALDIGCGRGEWLELLGENGYDACGVDLDDGMLEACKTRSFTVFKADGLEYLSQHSNESLELISAFHFVEHISFDALQRLIQEALRVLKPGGLLILETPNTENVLIGNVNFYLDPTHQRPVPVKLLSFLTEFFGFARSKEIRLQEAVCKQGMSLSFVFAGVSADCAVVAQKGIMDQSLSVMDRVFKRNYGISLGDAVGQYDSELHQTLQYLEERMGKAEEGWRLYYNVTNSISWRITAPLRFAKRCVCWLWKKSYGWKSCLLGNFYQKSLRSGVLAIKACVLKTPWLKRILSCGLSSIPAVKRYLQQVGVQDNPINSTLATNITPKTKQIYIKLKQEINTKAFEKGNS